MTLLDMTISCAIRDVINHLAGRKNKTANLHPYATRALFSGTTELTNRELLSILLPGARNANGGLDKKAARNWRSTGKERTMKLRTVRGHCLDLLRSQRVPNSDVVRSWTFALIHAAALDWAHSTPEALLEPMRVGDGTEGVDLSRDGIDRSRHLLNEMLDDNYAAAETSLERGDARALADTFLHYAAREVVAAMARAVAPDRALEHLIGVVYRELDSFGDPMVIDGGPIRTVARAAGAAPD